jgi:hypothetical protein
LVIFCVRASGLQALGRRGSIGVVWGISDVGVRQAFREIIFLDLLFDTFGLHYLKKKHRVL